MQFEDPITFECECGHEHQYPVAELLSLNAKCPACRFSLQSMGRSMQQTIDAARACGQIAIIAVDLELQWSVAFEDHELDALQTVGDFASLLHAKSSGLSPQQAYETILEKLYSHGIADRESINTDSPLHDLFRTS